MARTATKSKTKAKGKKALAPRSIAKKVGEAGGTKAGKGKVGRPRKID